MYDQKMMEMLKKAKPIKSESEKKAKMETLKELMDEMKSMGGDTLKDFMGKKDMKKVSVMSDSKEGLEKGLEKAKEIIEKPEMMEESEEAEESEESEEKEESKEDDKLAKVKELLSGLSEEEKNKIKSMF